MPPSALRVVLRAGDGERLSGLLRVTSAPAGLVQRARIVLLAAEGLPNAEIARRVGMSRPTVIQWRNRYEVGGVGGLGDLDRSGRPPVIDDAEVVVATLTPPPETLGVTHWSARLLARHLGISFARRWPGFGGSGSCSRGAGRRSSSPPTRNWTPRSAMWSGCI
jgi:transposase